LLWNQARGFRWLMCSNRHWTWLTPVPAGEIEFTKRKRHLARGTQLFKEYQTVYATTDFVLGECYWKVEVGEQARASEYIAPPESLNLDENDNEVTVTHGVLLPATEVARIFGLKQRLPEPTMQAPAQPNPFKPKAVEAWTWSGIWALALVCVIMAFSLLGNTSVLHREDFSVPAGTAPASPESQSFSQAFTIPEKMPLKVTLLAPTLDNAWQGVSVDLVEEATGEVISVYAEASHYSGVEGGEHWSEGARSVSKQTSEVPPGSYVLRVTPTFEPGHASAFSVSVAADDGAGVGIPLLIFGLLVLIPLYYSIRSGSFETERWNEAVFQSQPGVSTFPHAANES
jgi:hypothetical protein